MRNAPTPLSSALASLVALLGRAPTAALCAVLLVPVLPLQVGCGPTGTGDGDGDGDGDEGDGDGDGDGDVTCPAGGGSVCDVQNASSPAHIPQGEKATLSGVVATSDLFEVSMGLNGFFVSDDPPAFFGGVLVTVPNSLALDISRGDIVDLSGTVNEFSGMMSAGSETQIAVFPEEGDTVTVTGSGSIDPIDASDLDSLNSEGAEGVLFRINDVFVSSADEGGGRFAVQNAQGDTLRVGPSMYFYAPVEGEVITTLTGIVRYNTFGTGTYEISPRDAADVVSEGLTFPMKRIPELRDPSEPGYVDECAFDDDCDPVMLEKMVVVSPTLVGARDQDTNAPYLFGFYVADPEAVNASGELEPYSGIYVSMIPGANAVRENSYTFGQTAEDGPYGEPEDAPPGSTDFPQIGDVVSVAGQNKPYFDFAQLADIVVLRKEGTVDSLNDVTMPFPAQFPGNAADLAGGRPAYAANDYGPAAQPAVNGVDVEPYEGVLVELTNVQTENPCIPVPYNPGGGDPADSFLRDFGYWTVTGGAEISTQFQGYFDPFFAGYWAGLQGTDPQRVCENRLTLKCADSRDAGQTFTSLTGVVNYSFEVWRVNPRGPSDIAPSSLFVANNCDP